MVFYRTGLAPEGSTVGDAGSQRPAHENSVLFRATAEECDGVDPQRYPDTQELARAFSIEGGHWDDLATAVEPIEDDQQRRSILTASWSLACDES